MLGMLTRRPSRLVALSIVIAGASGVAVLLEPTTGCPGLVPVVLFTYFFGRSFGRLAATSASLGIAAVMLASNAPPLASGTISHYAAVIAAAWLCAALVSRHPRQTDSKSRLKERPVDEQPRQRNQTLQSIGSLFPGHIWTALPNDCVEYMSDVAREFRIP